MEPKQFPQHGGVCHVDAQSADQVFRHLDDDRVLALQREVIGDLTARQAAADDNDVVPDFRFTVQVVDRRHRHLRAGHRQSLRRGADGHDNEVRVQCVHIGHFRIHMHGR